MSQEPLMAYGVFMADCQYLWQSIKAELLEPHQIYRRIGQSAATDIVIVGISSGWKGD